MWISSHFISWLCKTNCISFTTSKSLINCIIWCFLTQIKEFKTESILNEWEYIFFHCWLLDAYLRCFSFIIIIKCVVSPTVAHFMKELFQFYFLFLNIDIYDEKNFYDALVQFFLVWSIMIENFFFIFVLFLFHAQIK